VQGPGYTRRFGHGVTLSESVDISPDVGATYTCDLAEADRVIPLARFDCFLLPNTLYALRDLEQALKQSLRLVRPGGTILASTASAFVPLDTGSIDYWRLTPAGWREVTRRAWPDCDIEIRQYGNPVAALAALHGIAAEELTAAELHANDPRYPVQIAIRCRKR
jgi:SAM-dependent methyltransferase